MDETRPALEAGGQDGPADGGPYPAGPWAAALAAYGPLTWAAGCAVAVLALLALQTRLHVGEVRVLTPMFMYVALAQAWNILGGMGGYGSLGQMAFFGIGGYGTAILMAYLGWSFFAALPASALAATVVAVLIGHPLLRLRGYYFSIATLGVAEGIREAAVVIASVTTQGTGITIPTAAGHSAASGEDDFYIMFLVLAATTTFAAAMISRSRFGVALEAIRQDETAAASVGVHVAFVKCAAFAFAAFVAALAGSVFALQEPTLYPHRVFDLEKSILIVMMVLVGGAGSIAGPIVGVTVVESLNVFAAAGFPGSHGAIAVALTIVVITLVPNGIVPASRAAWQRIRS